MRYQSPGGTRIVLCLAALALFAALSFAGSLCVGSLRLSPRDLVSVLAGNGPAAHRQIIDNIRLPRDIVAILVGLCLSLSGAILQAVMRNPLASPGLTGVSAGGALAAMLLVVLAPGLYGLLVPFSFLGALVATGLIYSLAWKRGASPTRLILAGVAVSGMLGAMTNSLMIFFPDRVSGFVDFLVGGLSGRSWRHVRAILPYALGGSLLSYALAPSLNVLALGDEAATSLGLGVERTRLVLLATSSVLAASAVSVAGLLGFVGLIAPHIARMLVGPDHRVLIPASALLGAGLVASCDALGRVLLDPVELPVGIVMAVIGSPFFLYLLRRREGAVDA